ncbi:MAG: hypothetical protein VX265_18340 [Myxococcota bacterium]|nr:hypothetical protein [Myxococcota bacterium]
MAAGRVGTAAAEGKAVGAQAGRAEAPTAGGGEGTATRAAGKTETGARQAGSRGVPSASPDDASAARTAGGGPILQGPPESATPARPAVPSSGLGQAPGDAAPDLRTDGIQRDLASGVEGEGAGRDSVSPRGTNPLDASDVTGADGVADARPDLDPEDIKPTVKK